MAGQRKRELVCRFGLCRDTHSIFQFTARYSRWLCPSNQPTLLPPTWPSLPTLLTSPRWCLGATPPCLRRREAFPQSPSSPPASRGILALPSRLLATVAHSWLRFMCLMLLGQREVLLSACILMCLVVCSCFESMDNAVLVQF